MSNELIKQQPIQAFIDARNLIKEKIQKIKQLFDEIDVVSKNMVDRSFSYEIERAHSEWERCKKSIDYEFWRELLQRGMITNVMTDTARNKYLIELRDHTPEFEAKNVFGLAQNIEHIYKNNAQQMVNEVYNKFIGCDYGDYHLHKKKDNLNGIGKSFRCSGNVRYDAYFNRLRYEDYNWYGINFGDLLRVCYLLDGKNMGTYAERLAVFANEVFNRGEDTIETDYFSIKCYQNGNQLVKWNTEKDYVRQRLNQIGGGMTLPDVMKKRYKQEHFEV